MQAPIIPHLLNQVFYVYVVHILSFNQFNLKKVHIFNFLQLSA